MELLLLPFFLPCSLFIWWFLSKLRLVFVSSDLCFGSESVALSQDDFGIFGSLYNLINCSRQAEVQHLPVSLQTKDAERISQIMCRELCFRQSRLLSLGYQGGFYLRIPDHSPTPSTHPYILLLPSSILPLLTCPKARDSFACRRNREESPMALTVCYELIRFIFHPEELLAKRRGLGEET